MTLLQPIGKMAEISAEDFCADQYFDEVHNLRGTPCRLGWFWVMENAAESTLLQCYIYCVGYNLGLINGDGTNGFTYDTHFPFIRNSSCATKSQYFCGKAYEVMKCLFQENDSVGGSFAALLRKYNHLSKNVEGRLKPEDVK